MLNQWIIDDAAIETHGDKGEWLLDPNALYNTDDLGGIYYQGSDIRYDHTPMDLAKLLKLYLGDRNFSFLTIGVPKSKVAEVKAILKTMEVKVR